MGVRQTLDFHKELKRIEREAEEEARRAERERIRADKIARAKKKGQKRGMIKAQPLPKRLYHEGKETVSIAKAFGGQLAEKSKAWSKAWQDYDKEFEKWGGF